jgi:ABC-type Fe3+-citrate transport system substrate-binding protein
MIVSHQLPNLLGKRVVMACAGAALVILPACGSGGGGGGDGGSGSGAISIQTDAGTLKLAKPATRIAVMQFQPLEDLLALGVQPTMIADEQQPGSNTPLPPQLAGKLGRYKSLGNRIAPSLEVLASEPVDLIIADKTEHLKDYAQFSRIAPTMILDTSSWVDFYPNIEKIGTATGKSSEAKQIIDKIKTQFSEAKTKLQSAAATRVLVGVPTPDKFFAFTAHSPQAGVVTAMGLTYAYGGSPGQLSVQVPLDALAPTKPDVVFLTAFPKDPKVTDTWTGNPLWDTVPAAANKKLFLVDRGIWSLGRGALSIPLMINETLHSFGVS